MSGGKHVAYHDELLAQALHLANRNEPNQTQADLRRAVSTAYYALFHLLVFEASQNWSRASSRGSFGRLFDHGQMRRASQRLLDSNLFPFTGEDPSTVQHLRDVAEAFPKIQDKRHIADYHNGITWTSTETNQEVALVEDAFRAWKLVRETAIAQEYLVSLLIKSRD